MPSSRTHDASYIDFHVKDLEKFGRCLTEAANVAFPKTSYSRYKQVHVLLLSWQDDNLGAIREILELQDVSRWNYLFQVDEWHIPSDRSQRLLRQRVSQFLNDYEHPETLLIIYYGGRM